MPVLAVALPQVDLTSDHFWVGRIQAESTTLGDHLSGAVILPTLAGRVGCARAHPDARPCDIRGGSFQAKILPDPDLMGLLDVGPALQLRPGAILHTDETASCSWLRNVQASELSMLNLTGGDAKHPPLLSRPLLAVLHVDRFITELAQAKACLLVDNSLLDETPTLGKVLRITMPDVGVISSRIQAHVLPVPDLPSVCIIMPRLVLQ
mmetsp:Transcript_104742/g.262434  ORF Transcript_104742/g.262434 Transcript_104742/m.262434 type:complete len:208 (-) Transcript_104742:444-1067(-)